MVLDKNLSAIIAALAKPIAAELARCLREELSVPGNVDSTQQFPDGCEGNPRLARTRIKAVPGAYKSGRTWVVSRSAYEAFYRTRAEHNACEATEDAYETAIRSKTGAR